MSYTKMEPQPGPRAPELDYDDTGPGLYPDESAVVLDDGTMVAVSVMTEWLENGAGASLAACARAIEADGTTRLTSQSQHIESNFRHTADVVSIERHGLPALAKEVLLLVLGEPATMVDEDDGAGGTMQVPMVAWSVEIRLNASIRQSLTVATQPVQDPGALLGL